VKLEWSSLRPLTEANIKTYLPTGSGVYLLWAQLKNDEWRCYYVGQADRLEKRLFEHIVGSEANECVKEHIVSHNNGYEYARVDKRSDREGIEKSLYDHFKPACNRADPGGMPIEVNLPAYG
jgi:excinuclease UvrABC nuclease subunit